MHLKGILTPCMYITQLHYTSINMCKEEEEDPSLQLALRQPWV